MALKNVGIVGVTGAVGAEFLRLLPARDFPCGNLRLFASARSAGRVFEYEGGEVTVEVLTPDCDFRDLDFVLMSAGSDVARQYARAIAAQGPTVIDNSSAFRGDPSVPLVVPEINGAAIAWHEGLIANPNCTTIIALMALAPLHQTFGVGRVAAVSEQAVSGAGAKALAEYEAQMAALVHGHEVKSPEAMRYRIVGNVIPEIGGFRPDGVTGEEYKLVAEGRKILDYPGFTADITCTRVGVARAHSIAMNIELTSPAVPMDVRRVLEGAPGIDVVDNPEQFLYPMPLNVAGTDNCQVGRIRVSTVFPGGVQLFVVGDQLLKGAALNAVQIAEGLLALERRKHYA